jgi:hypothetical protein
LYRIIYFWERNDAGSTLYLPIAFSIGFKNIRLRKMHLQKKKAEKGKKESHIILA